ncbi:Fork head transcription factor fhl1, partial [Globisporangium splendens]
MAALEEKKKALEKKFVESRPPLAYAKISGRVHDDAPFEMLITHLPTELGRGPLSTSPGPKISLGEQKALSRQHARIQWNQEKSGFELEVLGKNGMFASGKYIGKDKKVDLVSKMPLKIGPARIYFLAAVRSVCSTMSGFKLVQRAFEKAKSLGKGQDGMTAEEVVQQLMDCFPRSEDELGGKANLREFVTNYLELDTQSFQKTSGSSPPRYKMLPAAASTTATPASSSTTATGEAAKKKQKVDDSK